MPKSLNRKHTKIVATIGPASEDPEIIRTMIRSGMNVARINFSHGDHKTHGERIEIIRRVAQEENEVIAILADIQGPKIRIGTVADEPRVLKVDDIITLTLDKVPGEGYTFSLPHPEFAKDIAVGTGLLLDDGNIQFEVIDVTPRTLVCKVVIPGELKSRKGAIGCPNGMAGGPA